jgi:glycosyltransferase involved in cell wall biosynthesis
MTSMSDGAALPKILLLDHTATMGGGEIALLNLVKAIDRTKFSVSVMLFAEGPLAAKLRAAGVDLIIEPLDSAVGGTRKEALGIRSLLGLGRMWASFKFVRRLRLRLGELKPAIVHTNSLKSDILGGIAARWERIPVVWHVRDRIVPEYLPSMARRVFRFLRRIVPTRVVAISEAVRVTLPGRATVVHDGVMPFMIPQSKIENQKTSSEPQSNSSKITIAILGRISPWKGQHIFLQAAARVRERLRGKVDLQFQIIGKALFEEKEYEEEIRQLAQSPALQGAIAFLGFREDVPTVLAQMDILVHASTIGEPFGQVVAEGMMAGLSVIATRGGGVPEIVVDGESGLLVPMGDVPAMAQAIERLTLDGALRQRMGTAARWRVLEHFTIDRTARGVEAVWSEICRKR